VLNGYGCSKIRFRRDCDVWQKLNPMPCFTTTRAMSD
jgi:hypothetical protein